MIKCKSCNKEAVFRIYKIENNCYHFDNMDSYMIHEAAIPYCRKCFDKEATKIMMMGALSGYICEGCRSLYEKNKLKIH